ncbi:hypothetical protein [uncultured Traorella sp.]|uniref:hypothetical protein n=1 Tax=uncultured Traorella sp. TaxID=1929048 RepID=UPI0025DCCBE1|nr:hypothetical protein [uncultured Traorella sp.]
MIVSRNRTLFVVPLFSLFSFLMGRVRPKCGKTDKAELYFCHMYDMSPALPDFFFFPLHMGGESK